MHTQMNSDYIKRTGTKVAMFVANGVMNDSRVLKTAQMVQKLGFNITVYGIGKAKTTQTIKYHPFSIILLPNPRYRLIEDGSWKEYQENKKIELLIDVYTRNLFNQLQDDLPDILHTHDMNGIAVGGKLLEMISSKQVYWIHDIHEYVRGLTDIPEINRHFYAEMESCYIKSPDILSSVSPVLNNKLKEIYKLQKKPELVLNAPRLSDYDRHYKHTIRDLLKLKANEPLIVYSGNVKPIRSVDTIVEALGELSTVHLAIITNNAGEYVEGIKTRTHELGIANRVHFLPYVPFFNVTSFLSTANLGIHPIKRYPNAEIALPNKLFEYIHAGLPIIVSNNPAMSDFVEKNDCGSVFSVSDHHSLARQIEKVLDRQKKDRNWEKSILSIARNYSWEVQEEKLSKLYMGLPLFENNEKKFLKHSNSPLRILQLPVGGAGQPGTFARELNKSGVNAQSLEIGRNKYSYRSDFCIDDVRSLDDFSNLYEKHLKHYDIFHFHARTLMYKIHYPYPTGLDLLILRASGKKIFFHFRGSELRMASVFRKACPYHYVDENPDKISVNYLEPEQTIFSEYINSTCHGVFVTDPELKTYLPQAIIMPRVIDLGEWNFVGIKKTNVIKVVHAPSRRIVKGTDEILSAIEKLQSEGIAIEFRLIENMTNKEARDNYMWADVVIDQLRIGWYGVLAVEAMALGKAVVSYVRDDLKHNLPFPFPLVIANVSNIYEVLRDLASNSDQIEQIGLRGRKYVEQYHNTQHIIPLLKQAYQFLENPIKPRAINDLHIYQVAKRKRMYKKKFQADFAGVKGSIFSKLNAKVQQFVTLTQSEGLGISLKKAYRKLIGW